ncbi:MAG: hypothetical protein JWM85_2563 [Acidimicrobiaceae bacterium]|nr:hypothetical protein [Acidimicrobiaceae bacterium]
MLGVFGRDGREAALTSGADAVIIASTSFLEEIAADIRLAVENGSNVLTTAEEAAYPWFAHPEIAAEIDALARSRNVSVLGGGVNPGFAFDALVLTATGACCDVSSIEVERVVNLSGFSEAILHRLGIGFDLDEFDQRVNTGAITGHIGFPQSMRTVARGLGVAIERIDRQIEPVVGKRSYERPNGTTAPGLTAGFRQHYTAIVGDNPWFTALFTGHLDPSDLSLAPLDSLTVHGSTPVHMEIRPGLNPQLASVALVANSLHRLVAAPPGWVSVADLPPAAPAPGSPLP